jgi:hypothetical protein
VQSTPAAGKEEAEVVAGAVSAAADEVVVDDPAEMVRQVPIVDCLGFYHEVFIDTVK